VSAYTPIGRMRRSAFPRQQMRWSREEKVVLRRMVEEGRVDQEIADALGRTKQGVRKTRQSLGLAAPGDSVLERRLAGSRIGVDRRWEAEMETQNLELEVAVLALGDLVDHPFVRPALVLDQVLLTQGIREVVYLDFSRVEHPRLSTGELAVVEWAEALYRGTRGARVADLVLVDDVNRTRLLRCLLIRWGYERPPS
jgi:hypothetical protein